MVSLVPYFEYDEPPKRHLFDDMIMTMEVSTDTNDRAAAEGPTSENWTHDSARQVLHGWQHEDELMMMGIIPVNDDGDEDVIMQLDADEGLLPDLNNFVDDVFSNPNSSPAGGILSRKPDVAILSEESSIDDNSRHSEGDDSFFLSGHHDDKSCRHHHSTSTRSTATTANYTRSSPSTSSSSSPLLQGALIHLSECMRRSRQTRLSLYYSHHKSNHTEDVLLRTEFSSRQVDSYVSSTLMHMTSPQ